MNNIIDEKANSKEKEKKLFQKIKIIRNLKNHLERDRITNIIKEFNKKQEKDFFLRQKNISIGKINYVKTFIDNKHYSHHSHLNHINHHTHQNLNPNLSLGTQNQLPLQNKGTLKYISKMNSYSSRISQEISNNKAKNVSTSYSSKNEKPKTSKDLLNVTNNIVIENNLLKDYFDDIRKRISEEKSKNEDRENILSQSPYCVRQNLIHQENIFKRNLEEKKMINLIEEKLKKKTNRKNLSDLLMNRSKNYDKQNQEISIIDKNITDGNKYKENLWNITLRNKPINGKYEKVGYYNVGNKYDPIYTIFNINRNIEYFNNPTDYYNKKNKMNSIRRNKKNFYLSLNKDNYKLKIRHNLDILNSISNMGINGKNLLDMEDIRESKIKCKKIFYNKKEFDIMNIKQKEKYKSKNKNKYKKNSIEREIKINLDDIYKDKTFAQNYQEKDFIKNMYLSTKFSNLYK